MRFWLIFSDSFTSITLCCIWHQLTTQRSKSRKREKIMMRKVAPLLSHSVNQVNIRASNASYRRWTSGKRWCRPLVSQLSSAASKGRTSRFIGHFSSSISSLWQLSSADTKSSIWLNTDTCPSRWASSHMARITLILANKMDLTEW